MEISAHNTSQYPKTHILSGDRIFTIETHNQRTEGGPEVYDATYT